MSLMTSVVILATFKVTSALYDSYVGYLLMYFISWNHRPYFRHLNEKDTFMSRRGKRWSRSWFLAIKAHSCSALLVLHLQTLLSHQNSICLHCRFRLHWGCWELYFVPITFLKEQIASIETLTSNWELAVESNSCWCEMRTTFQPRNSYVKYDILKLTNNCYWSLDNH